MPPAVLEDKRNEMIAEKAVAREEGRVAGQREGRVAGYREGLTAGLQQGLGVGSQEQIALTPPESAPTVMIGTQHKTGTEWMLRVFKRVAALTGRRFVHIGSKIVDPAKRDRILQEESGRRDGAILVEFESHFPAGLRLDQGRGLYLEGDPADIEKSQLSGNRSERILGLDAAESFLTCRYEDLIADTEMRLWHDIALHLGFHGRELPLFLRAVWETSLVGAGREFSSQWGLFEERLGETQLNGVDETIDLADLVEVKPWILKKQAMELLMADRYAEAAALLSGSGGEWVANGEQALIVDPGFSRLQGHHYNTNVFFDRLLAAMGLKVGVLRAKQGHENFADDTTNSQPSFGFSPYDSSLLGDQPAALRLDKVNKLFNAEFNRVLGDFDCPLLVVHTARHTFIDGLCRYIHDVHVKTGTPNVVVLGIVEAELTNADHPDRQIALDTYRQALQHLRRLPKLHLLLFAETPEVCDFLAHCVDHSVKVLQMPYVGGFLDEWSATQTPTIDTAKTPVVGYAGQSRPERGALIIQQIANQVQQIASAPAQWSIQLDRDFIDRHLGEQGLADLDAFAAQPGIRVYGGDLPLADYQSMLADIDIMVMPYSERYRSTGSGIAIESLKLGQILVAPEDSTMARLARECNAAVVSFDRSEVDAVAAAVQEAIDRFAELAPRARAARATWAAGHDAQLQELKQFLEEAKDWLKQDHADAPTV